MSETEEQAEGSPGQSQRLQDELANIAELTKIRLSTLLRFDWSVDTDEAIGNPNLAPGQRNAFAVYCLHRYIETGYYDYDLFVEFIDDFRNYTASTFSTMNTVVLREIKRAIRYGGIYTGRPTWSVPAALAETLTQEDLPEWPNSRDTELAHLNPRCTAYKERQKRQMGQTTRLTQENTQEPQIPSSPRPQEQHLQTTPEQSEPRISHPRVLPSPRPQKQHPQTPSEQSGPHITRDSEPRNPSPFQPPQTQGISQPRFGTDQQRVNDCDTLPPRGFNNGAVSLDKLTGFVKLYNKDQHYTGQAYDVLDTKVRLMFRTCKACGIDPSGFKVVFEKIMSGSAFDYWIRYIKEEDTFTLTLL